MKLINTLAILLMGMNSSAFAAFSRPDINIAFDGQECTSGLSADVRVEIDRETFKFTAQCDFPFDQNFATETGHICRAVSGMCSDWWSPPEFSVTCDDGPEESVPVHCPTNN